MQFYANGPIAQGDMLIVRVDELPENVEPQAPEHGVHILTHSESGHHHVVDAAEGVEFFAVIDNELMAYITVEDEVVIKHLRDYDTHESITLPQGTYQIRRQIESSPEGFRRAID